MNKKNELENLGIKMYSKSPNNFNLIPNMEKCKIIDNADIAPLSQDSSVECYICSIIFNANSTELVKLKCSHSYCHECIMDWYIQCEKNQGYKNYGKHSKHECPYCRQDGGFLPLLPNETPIKNIHVEYIHKNNQNYNSLHQVCGAQFATKSGTCTNTGRSIYGFYCGHHKKYQNIFPKTLVDGKYIVVPENSEATQNIDNEQNISIPSTSTSIPSTSTSMPSTSTSINVPIDIPDLIQDLMPDLIPDITQDVEMEDVAADSYDKDEVANVNVTLNKLKAGCKSTKSKVVNKLVGNAEIYSKNNQDDISNIMDDLIEKKMELSKLIDSVKNLNKSIKKAKTINTEDNETDEQSYAISSEA